MHLKSTQAWQQLLFEGVMESIPQLALRLYYVISVSGVGMSRFQVVSLVFSTCTTLKLLITPLMTHSETVEATNDQDHTKEIVHVQILGAQ